MTNIEIIQLIRQIIGGSSPQTDISDLLWQHNCNYLLSLYPNKYSSMLLLEKVVNKSAVKERYSALQPLFETTDFSYAVIKGAVLSKSAYGDDFIRSSGDIDILIRKQDSDLVKSLLYSCGFVQGRVTDNGIVPFSRQEILFQTTMSHQTAPYVKATGSKLCPYINVDLNIDIMWGESKEKSDMNFVLSHITQTEICGTTVCKLTPEMEFISLCLHHYKDMNSLYLLSTRGLKLSLLCDIYYYIKKNTPDKRSLMKLAEQLHVGEYTYYCLFYSNLIFDDEVLKDYLLWFKSMENPTIMNSYGLSDNERKTWEIPFCERLFHPNLPEYLRPFMTANDLQKIKTNELYICNVHIQLIGLITESLKIFFYFGKVVFIQAIKQSSS